MPGLIHDHLYEADKAAICAKHPNAVDAFEAIEWALLRNHVAELPLLMTTGRRSARYFVTAGPAPTLVPPILVVLGEENAGGETKIVLLAARTL